MPKLQQSALQNLRNMTVQIRHRSTDAVVGTGFLVSREGRIATCAHVVLAAGVLPRTGRPAPGSWLSFKTQEDAKPGEVGVLIPGTLNESPCPCRAIVSCCFPDHDDDVVLLQILDPVPQLTDQRIAVLGPAEGSEMNTFRSYGYRRLERYGAAWADGKILGIVEAPEGRTLRSEPIQIKSGDINKGMSGAPVLDIDRNLVVGLVCETWFPDKTTKDSDTAWAVDSRVLGIDPFSLLITTSHEISASLSVPERCTLPPSAPTWRNVPSADAHWVEREALERELANDFADPDCRITTLIGFGGTGKSSLARRALDVIKPASAFWWNFQQGGVEGFFEAALNHLTPASSQVPRSSAAAQAHLLASMLSTGRHIFVLDNLEAVQHQREENRGLLRNVELANFLRYAAGSWHTSWCLITSRLQLMDLVDLRTCRSREVGSLSADEGRNLLRANNVAASDQVLNSVTERLGGHALSLRLVSSHLKSRMVTDEELGTIAPAATQESQSNGEVANLLRFYDAELTDDARVLVKRMSLFRIPFSIDALVYVSNRSEDSVRRSLGSLLQSRVLDHDADSAKYSLHPLVRSFYEPQVTGARDWHAAIAQYYVMTFHPSNLRPTLVELSPLIEAVHHACAAGMHMKAHQIFENGLMQGDRRYLLYELSAPETILDIAREIYFPNGDLQADPPLEPMLKSFVLNRVATCLMDLARFPAAIEMFKRANSLSISLSNWHSSSIDWRNLSQLYWLKGDLQEAGNAATKALEMSQRASDSSDIQTSLCWRAWIEHLVGNMDSARAGFAKALSLNPGIEGTPWMTELRGVQYATHLWQAGELVLAEEATLQNLRFCLERGARGNACYCHSLLGDLSTERQDIGAAREHHEEAIRLGRQVGKRDPLLRALTARGRWFVHLRNTENALRDFNEVVQIATQCGYRIYEADSRIGLAMAYGSISLRQAAHEASIALEISNAVGYFWGMRSAEVLLSDARRFSPLV